MSNYADTVSLTTNYESRRLEGEYGKHLASVVANNSNLLILSKISFNFDLPNFRIYYFLFFFSEVYKIYNLSSNCICSCNCNSSGTGKFICLCVCKCTAPKAANGFCICVCKNQRNSCICICICNDKNCTNHHTCENCLVKVDIGTLKDESYIILYNLRWIRCCVSRLENQSSNNVCCYCICSLSGQCDSIKCKSYCYCREGTIKYSSIISKINSIELLFVQISQKIPQLLTLKNTLSLICLIATKCPKCPDGCCKDINTLITNVERSLNYYYLFGYRINEIRPFIEYKFNYNKTNEILLSLQKSIKCFSTVNKKIMDDIVNNSKHSKIPDKLLMSFYEHYSIMECYVVINKLYESAKKIDQIFYLIFCSYGCKCIKSLESQNNNKLHLPDINFINIVNNLLGKSKGDFNQLVKLNEIRKINELDTISNHLCLCMVNKYVLYEQIVKLIYLIGIDNELLSTRSKKFDKYINWIFFNSGISKLLIVCIKLLYKLSKYILAKYEYKTKIDGEKVEIMCLCKYSEDRYYPYLISIILYLSSLIENIWAMDSRAIVTAIQSLSNLYSELWSYDFRSINDKRGVSCTKVCGLVVNKQCPGKKTEKCCCWCVACYNFLLGYIYLCFQFRLYKAIKKQEDCTQIKDFCTIKECECTCPKGNVGCCLLKLALCSELPKKCEELEKWLGGCGQECTQPNGCCKKILAKVIAGQADLLVIGCKCNCASGAKGDQVKAQCVLFNNPWGGRSAGVVIACKCKDPANCCCLNKAIEKLNGELKQMCEECKCQQLKEKIQQLCADPSCCGAGCPCTELKKEIEKICGKNSQCLCQEIKKLENLCSGNTCLCKDEECCRCVCCKLAVGGVRILSRACKLNVLEPYKRIIIELLSGTQDKGVIRQILNSINSRTLSITSLVKNNYSTHFNTYTDHKNIANSFPSLTMGYGYESVYEHQEASNSDYRGINGTR